MPWSVVHFGQCVSELAACVRARVGLGRRSPRMRGAQVRSGGGQSQLPIASHARAMREQHMEITRAMICLDKNIDSVTETLAGRLDEESRERKESIMMIDNTVKGLVERIQRVLEHMVGRPKIVLLQ